MEVKPCTQTYSDEELLSEEIWVGEVQQFRMVGDVHHNKEGASCSPTNNNNKKEGDMTGFRITPDNDDHNVDPVKWLENYIEGAKRLEKILKEGNKHHEKKHKTYSKADVTCWSLLLLLTSPWTGLYVLKALDWAKAEWALMLLPK